jgi:hypothetical protein
VLTTVLDKAGVSRGWADSKNTAVFMDDGHGVQPEALSEAQAISLRRLWPGKREGVGSNSYLARFRSVADSFLDNSVEGEHVYANPDFELILKYIVHFLEGQRKAPERTSETFVLPVWMWATFWKLLRGAKVLAYIPLGEHLFTSP